MAIKKLTLTTIKNLTLPDRPLAPGEKGKDMYEYIKTLKAFVTDLEKGNYNFLIFYRTDGEWWQLIGHSVLYYRYEYAQRINRNIPNLRYDHDYYSPSKTGVCSVKNISELIRKFKRIDCEAVLKKKDVVIIHLDKLFTHDEVEIFANVEEHKADEIHKILQPKVVCPDFFHNTKELHLAIADNIRKSRSPHRDKYGEKGFDLSWRLVQGAVSMSNGQIDKVEFFRGAIKALEQLRSWLNAMHTIRIDTFNNDTVLRIARLIAELQSQAQKELDHAK